VETLQFLDRLRQSRLLGEDQLVEVMRCCARTADAQVVAGSLVEQGILTAYQARQLWDGKVRGLALGPYRILDEVGKGGFGEVYKALHTYMDRVVALKVVRSDVLEDRKARALFRREVLATTQLSHPNIVMAFDANEDDGLLYWAMEFVEGTDLDSLVQKGGPLGVPLAVEMFRQVALALGHAHEKRMVHRDVKPANLLVPKAALEAFDAAARGDHPTAGHAGGALVKVVDFGLARLHTRVQGATFLSQNESTFCGTPDYVSPEQARTPQLVDIRSDLYSLGCTFHYALTGQRPFKGATIMEVVLKQLHDDPPRLEELRPEIPAELAAIVRRLLAKDPAQRFQTPTELAAELASLQSEIPLETGAASAPARPVPGEAGTRQPTAATVLVPKLVFWNGPTCEKPEVAVPPEQGGPDRRPPRPADGSRSRAGLLGQLAALPCAGAPRKLPEVSETALPPDNDATPTEAPRPPAAPPVSERDLRRHWRRWVGVIRSLVGGKRLALDERDYRRLHRVLLDACRERHEKEGPLRPAWQRLERLLEPWLSVQTLGWADKATLDSLLVCCGELEEELGLEDTGLKAWHLGLMAALLAAALLLPLYLDRLPRLPAFSQPTLSTFSRFIETHPVACAALGGPVLLVVLVSLLLRVLR
jgi:serine/threonine protein kinase